MAKKLLVVVAVLGLVGASLLAQSKPSIQGVWRPVEVTVTNSNPNPAPGVIGKGTHTNLQPGLLFSPASITARCSTPVQNRDRQLILK